MLPPAFETQVLAQADSVASFRFEGRIGDPRSMAFSEFVGEVNLDYPLRRTTYQPIWAVSPGSGNFSSRIGPLEPKTGFFVILGPLARGKCRQI